MQFLTNVPDLQKVCQNLDPPKKGSLLQPRKLLCGGVGYMYSGEFARASSPTPPPPRRRLVIALPPLQSVFAAVEAGDYYSRRTSLAKKVLRLSFAWQNSAFEVRSST
jgi:hypothetical protein